jgi:hypothetical protein
LVLETHDLVESVIARFRRDLGDSAPVYRNHVMRSLNYQSLLLGDVVSDTAALAWSVHDIGIWTASTFDYLGPSAAALPKLAEELGVADVDEAIEMVLNHHRVRRVADKQVETFRQADLIDVSRGVVRFGLPRRDLRDVVRALPYLGFHRWLARGLAGYAVKHPSHPAPMVRW